MLCQDSLKQVANHMPVCVEERLWGLNPRAKYPDNVSANLNAMSTADGQRILQPLWLSITGMKNTIFVDQIYEQSQNYLGRSQLLLDWWEFDDKS